jgi:hypothetical protein
MLASIVTPKITPSSMPAYRLEIQLTKAEWEQLERAVTPKLKFLRRKKKSDVIRRLMRRYLEDSYDPDY